MDIFPGSASNALARNIASLLNARVGEVEKTEFKNGEMRVRVIGKNGKQAVVVQSLPNPVEKNLVEFCLICDALHRQGVTEIYAVIPWLGYSKQDKVFRPGEALSVKVIAKMLQVVPMKHLYVIDLHNQSILGFFDIPVTNLSAKSLFVDYFKKKVTEKTVVVAPDEGAIKSSTSFARELGVPVVYVDKERDLATGAVTIRGINRNVSGMHVIIIDDMIVTGGTLIETSKYLYTSGVSTISIGATHHLYVPEAQEAIENAGVSEVVVTDSIESHNGSKKLKVLSVASLVASELRGSPTGI